MVVKAAMTVNGGAARDGEHGVCERGWHAPEGMPVHERVITSHVGVMTIYGRVAMPVSVSV